MFCNNSQILLVQVSSLVFFSSIADFTFVPGSADNRICLAWRATYNPPARCPPAVQYIINVSINSVVQVVILIAKFSMPRFTAGQF